MLGRSVRYARNNELYMTDTIIQSCLKRRSPISVRRTNEPAKEGGKHHRFLPPSHHIGGGDEGEAAFSLCGTCLLWGKFLWK